MIDIDGSDWKVRSDVYNAILPLIGAPGWHGANANALVESMVWGEINSIEPPYLVRIHSATLLPAGVKEELGWIKEDLHKARAAFRRLKGHDVDVDIEVLP